MNLRTIILLSTVIVCQILRTTAAAPAIGADASQDSWYTIQVSSSREAEGADKDVAALKAQGLDAVSSHEAVEGKGMWYRVYVGRFRTKQEAETAASRMKAEGIISGYWVKELKDTNIPYFTSEPSRAEQAVSEKEEPRQTEGQLAGSGKPPEPRTGAEEQVRIETPQLSAEAKGAATTEPSVDIEERAVVEGALPELAKEKPLEPRVGVQEQLEAQRPRKTGEEGAPVIAPSKDVADRQVVEGSLTRRPSPEPGSPSPESRSPSPEFRRPSPEPGSPSPESRSPSPEPGSPSPEPGAGDIKPFYMGIRIGGVYMPGVDEFTVSTPTTGWYFEDKFLINTLVASYSLNKSFSIDFSIEKIMNTEFNSLFATLGTKFRFFTSNTKGLFNLSPYVRGAPAWGNMSWDDMPGSFDSSIGGELGTGIDIISLRSNLRLGLDMSYRSMKFDYNAPSAMDVTSSRDNIDFSGYSLTGFLNYYF